MMSVMSWARTLLTLTLGATAGASAQPKPIPAGQAASALGKRASIEGTVAAVRVTREGDVWLDLEQPSPRQALSVLVPARTAGQIAQLREYRGKRIVVTGLVDRIQGVLRIEVTDPSQLVVAPESDRIPCDG